MKREALLAWSVIWVVSAFGTVFASMNGAQSHFSNNPAGNSAIMEPVTGVTSGTTQNQNALFAPAPLTSEEMTLLASSEAQAPGLLKESAGARTQCYYRRGHLVGCHTYTLAGSVVGDGLLFGFTGWLIGWFAAGPAYPFYWGLWTVGGAAVGALIGWNDYYSMPKS